MAWISESKLYQSKRWYCPSCDVRKRVEFNPDWLADGKPMRWSDDKHYDWFTRCSCCHRELYPNTYGCPRCGHWQDSDEDLLEILDYSSSGYASYEFGIDGHEWNERHRCPKCKMIYWIHNADY